MAKKIMFDPENTIFLIDGSSFLYRAYYGVRPLHTSKGVPVQAVYSFCRMIRKLVSKFGAIYVAIVWDSKGKTTRHEMYEEYKATRQAPPADIFDQKELILEISDAIGLSQVAQSGIEADDIIFSIAQELKKKGNNIVVVSSDKDLGQMLDDHVVMYDAFKDELTDVPHFEEKMGFEVAKLPFYFALLGDTSDNIPGVKGIGKKGALELVNQFDSLETLYKNIDNIARPRMKHALQENKKNAFLSEKLFLLQYHSSGVKKGDLLFHTKQWAKARAIFKTLEFKSLLKEIDKDSIVVADVVQKKIDHFKQYAFKTITTVAQLKDLCMRIKKSDYFALDTETCGIQPLQDACVGISICLKEGESFYLPFGHQTNEEQLTLEAIETYIKPIFENKQYKKILHHAKFDQLVLHAMGIELDGVVFDTLIAARLLAKDWQRSSLKDLSVFYLEEPMLTFAEVMKIHKCKNFSYVPLELATYYAAADSHQTYKLYKVFKKLLKKEKLEALYDEIEFPLIQVLYNMEKEGIYLNTDKLARLDKKITKELADIEAKIFSFVGKEYKDLNLNSPKQVEQLLFYDLALPPKKKSAKGTGYSTDQSVLAELAKIHPVPGLILKHREYAKLKNTYIDALPSYVNPDTHRVHTTFSQTAVATGRLASSDPNLQNIPSDGSTYGLKIRDAFEPKQGNLFLAADYSQIELRVLAHLSGDRQLIHAFLSGQDIHTETAARLFDIAPDKIKKEQRQIGKRINFSILYGMTPYGLSKDLGISLSEAKYYITKYFEQYPGVSSWMEGVVDETKKHGYVTTYWGRRRYIPGIYEKNKNLYELARRVAINTKAQGTAAEIMKKGMIDLDHAFSKNGLEAQILLQIHDELLITFPQAQQKETEALVIEILESVVDWKVPFEINVLCGESWMVVSK